MTGKVFTLWTFMFLSMAIQAQTISGILLDKQSGEALIGATVMIKGTGIGAATDIDGKFELKITQAPPFVLSFSYIGYEPQDIEINKPEDLKRSFNIKLGTSEKLLADVEIVDTRITQKQQENPLTIESMGLQAIKQTASATFYEGLGTLKGVDMTAASLGFVIINTRGFNSTSPVRSLQLLDGADNQAPGLNFSIGNFAGASEIDIQKVDLIVGASSPLYGPNAFNGVINLQTKNPFYYTGLTAMVKGGERGIFESAIRYARAFRNKYGTDKFAFKINFSYLRANDWVADNMAAATNSWQPRGNFAGYDAVNRYGDELPTRNSFNFDGTFGRRQNPGLGQIFRTGYEERDVLDYNIQNIKANTALHYKINEKIEARAAYYFGYGTTVYQGDNRYSLRDLRFHQLRAEISQADKFFIRAYTTMENAGTSYDAVFTAIKMQEVQKGTPQWMTDYQFFWNNGNPFAGIPSPKSQVNTLLGDYSPTKDVSSDPGFQNFWLPYTITNDTSQWENILSNTNRIYDSILQANRSLMEEFHANARQFADTFTLLGGKRRLVPGTKEFEDSLKAITSRTAFEQNGTRFFDRSKLVHVQGEYKFEPKLKGQEKPFMDILTGASFRMYLPESRGTVFSDTITQYRVRQRTTGEELNLSVNEFNAQRDSFDVLDFTRRRITNWEVGAYISLNKRFTIKEVHSVIVTATTRFDRNQNFAWKRKDGKWDPIITPAASVVYAYKNNHTVRFSFSSGVRNPTLQDQFLYYNVGRAILVGNLNGVDSLVTIESYQDYLGSDGFDNSLLRFNNVAAVRPEKALSLEAGYKGVIKKKLYLDGSAYVSWYRDFLGFQIGALLNSTVTNIGGVLDTFYSVRQIYRVAANATNRVMTYGASVGLNYYFVTNYAFNANYSWNRLNKLGADDPIIPAFNTPEHKFNVGFSGQNIKLGQAKGFGFNVNYKWIQGFEFEGSPQFTGRIPTYSLLDAQISWEVQKWYTTFKLGGSNLVSNRNFQTYGGPGIGRLVYGMITINLDQETLESKSKKWYDKVKTKW